jgi:hypothetical protein
MQGIRVLSFEVVSESLLEQKRCGLTSKTAAGVYIEVSKCPSLQTGNPGIIIS